jgi:hypothetical protein
VVARLPFGPRGNARANGADALAIGRIAQQETGQDRTLLAAECGSDISRGRILGILSSLGLVCTFFACCEHAGGTANLIEIDRFVRISDQCLDDFRVGFGPDLHRLLPLGGYAVPLIADSPSVAVAASGVP